MDSGGGGHTMFGDIGIVLTVALFVPLFVFMEERIGRGFCVVMGGCTLSVL